MMSPRVRRRDYPACYGRMQGLVESSFAHDIKLITAGGHYRYPVSKPAGCFEELNSHKSRHIE